jgi:SAM-dependent methyltransferase
MAVASAVCQRCGESGEVIDRELSGTSLERAISLGERLLHGNDLDFYRRVWTTDLDVYRMRLRAIGFTGMDRVLDAGAGFGQWTMCLAEDNIQVDSNDYSAIRVAAVQAIVDEMGIDNVSVSQQSIESLDYPDRTFDGIFCYGVLFLADFRKAVQEFERVLKSGGRLYISCNGAGWYLYNLIRPHNPSGDFNPRRMALDTFANTLGFALVRKHHPEKQLIIPGVLLRRYLEAHGFERAMVGGEGTLNVADERMATPFFASRYYGLEGVYEVLARKRE